MWKVCTTGKARIRDEYGRAGQKGYSRTNFNTEKSFLDGVSSGTVEVFRSANIKVPLNGKVFVEGPWFPHKPKWYAVVEVQDNKIVCVLESGKW